jgi:hypothetical protein
MPDTNKYILCVDDMDKCDLLHSFFCSISNLDDNNCNPPNLELRTNSKLALIEFTINEISDILKSLNIKIKASGHDLISHHMLKNTANTVSIPLELIFDCSIQTSTFPDH